ncbi:hypothetical protein DIPPA_15831b, partial [Diplonema papillatum]
ESVISQHRPLVPDPETAEAMMKDEQHGSEEPGLEEVLDNSSKPGSD